MSVELIESETGGVNNKIDLLNINNKIVKLLFLMMLKGEALSIDDEYRH